MMTTIHLIFTLNIRGDYDLLPLIEKQSKLSTMLQNDVFFKQFYLEMGALSW